MYSSRLTQHLARFIIYWHNSIGNQFALDSLTLNTFL